MVKVILIKEVLIVIIFLVFFNFRVSLAQTIAFERNGGIWVADTNGDNQEKICKGSDPDISPDGTLIAFTEYQNDSRYIAIVEIKSKKIKILKSIPGNNSHGPKWSPNGNRIIFSYFHKYHWSVGLVGKNYSDFRVLFAPVDSIYSPNWRDSNTIVCHNNILLFLTNLHGSLINQIPLNHLHVSAGKSSAAEFVYSNSGRYILFDAHTEYFFANLFGPISALYLHDEKNDTSKRITSPEICAVNHAWMSDETVLFEGFENSDIEVPVGDYYKIHRRIYKVNIRNNKTNILIEDAADPSVSIK